MSDRTVSVAEAKARLSELVAAAEAGEDVVITKRGVPVAHITALNQPRKAIDLEWLMSATAEIPMGRDSADLIRQMRDSRY